MRFTWILHILGIVVDINKKDEETIYIEMRNDSLAIGTIAVAMIATYIWDLIQLLYA